MVVVPNFVCHVERSEPLSHRPVGEGKHLAKFVPVSKSKFTCDFSANAAELNGNHYMSLAKSQREILRSSG